MNIRKLMNSMVGTGLFCVGLFALTAVFAPSTIAQDDATVVIDSSKVPATASSLEKFVPRGWKIQEQLEGYLSDDIPDYVLKLVEDKPDTNKDGNATDRSRALLVILQKADGTFTLAGINGKLLQCTGCGGAFYGVVEAPANISIDKSVLVIQQDSGSRDVSSETYRFRYEASTGKFLLIGFDFSDNDRATGDTASESTNYVTGVRITTRGKAGKKGTPTKSTIKITKIYLNDIDSDKFTGDAVNRLGLG